MNKKQRRERERRAQAMAEKLGATCRSRREALKLSLDAVSAASGLDKSNLSKLERGALGSSLVGYADLARALGWTLGEMLTAAFPRDVENNHGHGA